MSKNLGWRTRLTPIGWRSHYSQLFVRMFSSALKEVNAGKVVAVKLDRDRTGSIAYLPNAPQLLKILVAKNVDISILGQK
jgi:hypothetical protein